MGITVHLGECPSGDVKGVGCEHGTHCRLYSIAIFSCQLKSSLRRRWSALVVGGDQGPTMRRSRIRSFSSLHNATFKPHCHIDYSGLLFFFLFISKSYVLNQPFLTWQHTSPSVATDAGPLPSMYPNDSCFNTASQQLGLGTSSCFKVGPSSSAILCVHNPWLPGLMVIPMERR